MARPRVSYCGKADCPGSSECAACKAVRRARDVDPELPEVSVDEAVETHPVVERVEAVVASGEPVRPDYVPEEVWAVLRPFERAKVHGRSAEEHERTARIMAYLEKFPG